MKRFTFLYFSLLIFFVNATAQNLKGYYTRLDFDDFGISGKYADIVIDLKDKGQFVFSREYSYQPYWQAIGEGKVLVDRLIPRIGDGTNNRPDKNNICSNAAIVDKTDSTITVHWRYASDMSKPSFIDFQQTYNEQGNPSKFYAEYADEYFTVRSDGNVSRIAKKGCYRLDEWEDPKNQFTQEFQLNNEGISQKSLTKPQLSNNYGTTLSGSALIPIDKTGTILHFDFDDALSNGNGWTTEKISNSKCPVTGVEDYWEAGISGSCLLFDSYSSAVIMPSEIIPVINGNFSISVWIAPVEYAFNKAAILDHLNGSEGYFLGMNRLGEIEFMIGNSSEVFEVKTAPLPLYDWTHIVATYNITGGLKVYLNGKLAADKNISEQLDDALNTDLSIGMTKSFKQYPYGAEREVTKGFNTNMVFSGLIDELMVFDNELKSDKIDSQYNTQKPKQIRRFLPYLLPSEEENTDSFGANYTQLKFHKTWDGLWRTGKYSDIVINFEKQPWRYVFWRGTRYLPSLVTDCGRNGIWSSDQGPEVFKGLCYEHMSDMLCRYSNIRLISGSAARVIVHWRNASADIAYKWPELNSHGQGIWTDEYWTIYPDGTSVRHQLLHNSVNDRVIEMNQNEILLHPGSSPEEAILNDAVYLGNENGEIEARSRPQAEPDKNKLVKKNLLYTNLNSLTKQFQIGEIGTQIETHLHMDVWWNGWNHYPAQLIPSDGTVANKYDRTASFCVSTFRELRREIDKETIESMQIYGLTKLNPKELTPLNRSWNFAPQIVAKTGCEGLAYNKGEKAYYLKQTEKIMQFQIAATTGSPIVNPAFVIKNINSGKNVDVSINDNKMDCKSGIELDTEGQSMLVIWMEYNSDRLAEFEIRID